MNVEVVQRRLWEQSTQHREHRESDSPLFPVNHYEGRVRNLMDLMHQPQWIAAACDRVLKRSRGKVAGVDGVTASESIGILECRSVRFAQHHVLPGPMF